MAQVSNVIYNKRDLLGLPVPSVFAEPTVLEFQSDDDSVNFPVYDGSVDTDEIYNEANAPQGLSSGTEHFMLIGAWGGPVETTSFDVTLGRQFNYDTAGSLLRNRINLTTMSSLISNGSQSFARHELISSVTEVGVSHFQFGGGTQGTTHGATVLVMDSASLGVKDQDWFRLGSPTVYQTDGVTIETDYSTQPVSQSTEEYIILTGYRVLFDNNNNVADDQSMQWTVEIDGVDMTGIRSGNTTGGASRPGRGFGFSWDSGGVTWQSMSAVCKELPKGTREFVQIGHRDGDTGSISDRLASLSFIIRRNMFQKSAIKKVSTAVGPFDPDNDWTATDFEVSITSSNKVLVIFSTSVMRLSSSHMPVFRIVDASDTKVFGGDTTTDGFSCYSWNAAYSSQDTPSTDADVTPFFLCAVFDNPGTETWKIQYTKRDNGINNAQEVLWNCRDDGSDGFDGYMMALELMLATDT